MLKQVFLSTCLVFGGCSQKQPVSIDYPDVMIDIMTAIQAQIAEAKEKKGPILNLCVLFRTKTNPPTKTTEVLLFQISDKGAAWIPPNYSQLELAAAKKLGEPELKDNEKRAIADGKPLVRCGAVGVFVNRPHNTI